MPVLLEVNVAGEESKYGVAAARRSMPSSSPAAALERVGFAGLMTMPPARARSPRRRGRTSRRCGSWRSGCGRTGRRATSSRCLSMGTSQDYEVAVEEGATICRLGNVLCTADRVIDIRCAGN